MAFLRGVGNSNNITEYYFNDTRPLNGTAYYRLQQTDNNGNAEYSSIVATNCTDEKAANIKVYPNPISNKLTLETEGDEDIIRFQIINPLGIVVYKGVFSEKITIQTTDFVSGIYLIKFEALPTSKTTGKTFENKKIIKR
ncbi:MAG: T9SS type A sorting domain-containing protein [Microscillaceae bacterium]|nr:T9SS type A sorting domain-containing protein [Microscillaceae bacterium]